MHHIRHVVVLLIAFAVFACFAIAQEAPPALSGNFGAVGVSYNHGASPAVAGSAALGHQLGTSTYSFTLFDALPNPSAPNTVVSTVSTGLLQRVGSIRNWDIFLPGTAGVAWTGQNTGWSWSSGGMLAIPIKSLYLYPNVRVVRTNVGGGPEQAYGLIAGVLIGGRFGP